MTLLPLILATTISAASIQLWAQSDDSSVNGLGVAYMHEGAGIDYCFLGGSAATVNYDLTTHYITTALTDTINMYLLRASSLLQMSVADEPDKWTIQEGVLTFDGVSNQFYACKKTQDPYNYSTNSYQVVLQSLNDDCKAIKLTVTEP